MSAEQRTAPANNANNASNEGAQKKHMSKAALAIIAVVVVAIIVVAGVFGFRAYSEVVPEKLRTLDRGRPWRDSQFASTRLSPSRDMSR